MILPLQRFSIHLDSKSAPITEEWQRLFSGSLSVGSQIVDFKIQLDLLNSLPDLPSAPPIFVDEPTANNDNALISVYQLNQERFLLHYHDGALVEIPLTSPPNRPTIIKGSMTPTGLAHGRLEDLTFTSLAAGLRRRGLYLVHAFVASKNGRALLISGASGSGKTSTGLNLLLNGWQLLANDVVMLERRDDGIFALPTPGGVNIRPPTFEQLPKLKHLLADPALPQMSVTLSSHKLIQGKWAEPAKVAWLCFPQIEQRPSTTLAPQNRAVALVRLMQESVDRWDETAVPKHITFLEKLCQQTAVYDLQLGQDFSEMIGRIEAKLFEELL